jgi:hypothetical protein
MSAIGTLQTSEGHSAVAASGTKADDLNVRATRKNLLPGAAASAAETGGAFCHRRRTICRSAPFVDRLLGRQEREIVGAGVGCQ